MKKDFLLSYKFPTFSVLADWVDYELQIETVWLFGLFRTQKEIKYRVYDYQDSSKFCEHWDNLIKNKQPLKQNS
jgi:hypothetical protein